MLKRASARVGPSKAAVVNDNIACGNTVLTPAPTQQPTTKLAASNRSKQGNNSLLLPCWCQSPSLAGAKTLCLYTSQLRHAVHSTWFGSSILFKLIHPAAPGHPSPRSTLSVQLYPTMCSHPSWSSKPCPSSLSPHQPLSPTPRPHLVEAPLIDIQPSSFLVPSLPRHDLRQQHAPGHPAPQAGRHPVGQLHCLQVPHADEGLAGNINLHLLEGQSGGVVQQGGLVRPAGTAGGTGVRGRRYLKRWLEGSRG